MSPVENVMYDKIRTLLQQHAADSQAKYTLAPLIAERSLLMNHLYEDIGFRSRTEMGKFMKANFPTLAEQKPSDKLWKKFLYDTIDMVAPACATCDDQLTCFRCLLSEQSA